MLNVLAKIVKYSESTKNSTCNFIAMNTFTMLIRKAKMHT